MEKDILNVLFMHRETITFGLIPEIIDCNDTKQPQGGERQIRITKMSPDIEAHLKLYSIPAGFFF